MVQFWQKTWYFVHGRFHKTGPHKEFAMYSDISLPKVVKLCIFCKHYVHIFGTFCCFPCKNELLATLLRVFHEISLISPQNSYVSCQMYFYFVLCLCFIKTLHKIKFHAFCVLLKQTIYFVEFSVQNVKFYAICNVWHSCSTPNVFCFKELPFGLCGVSLEAMFF